MGNKICFNALSLLIILFLSVFISAPRCKFLTETNKNKWPPPQILYKDVSLWPVLCKNNKVYVLATEGSAKIGDGPILFFIYDLKEGKWYGPERVGERLNNEILSHNRELVKKKYELYEPDDRFRIYFPEFDVDEEGRVHIFYGGAYKIDKEIRLVPPPITTKMYLIYARREPDGRWEEQIFKSFPPDEYPIYPLENTGIYLPLTWAHWVSAFGRKLAVGHFISYHLVLKPSDQYEAPEQNFIYIVKNEDGNWDLYDLAELLPPEAKKVGPDSFVADAGFIGEDSNLYIVLWQGPTIYTKGVEVKALFLKIDTKEKRLKWIRRMRELEMENVDIYREPLAGVLDNFAMKVRGNKFYYANIWRGKIYLHSWELIGDDIGNVVWEFVSNVAWFINLSMDVKKNVYLLNALNLHRKKGNRWIMEDVLDGETQRKYKIGTIYWGTMCVDDEGYAWVFFEGEDESQPYFVTNIYYVRKKVE
jgi:hypothetical protein